MRIVINDILPFEGFDAMTVWPFIFSRKALDTTVLRHETIHAEQQKELYIAGILLAFILFVFGCGWWSLIAVPLFFWIYLIEWVIRLVVQGKKKAYRNISFEREAYINQGDIYYLGMRQPFAWLNYF